MTDDENRRRFERLALPHLGAAYNLARWLTHNDHDAQDVVQDAFVRALRYIGGFRGDNARAWVLQVVRNTCWTWLEHNRPAELVAQREYGDDDAALHEIAAPAADEPPAQALRKAERVLVNQAIAALPFALREVLVLRELEELSYNDIARIVGIPLGTVMSRLSRARARLRLALQPGERPLLTAVANPANNTTTNGPLAPRGAAQ